MHGYPTELEVSPLGISTQQYSSVVTNPRCEKLKITDIFVMLAVVAIQDDNLCLQSKQGPSMSHSGGYIERWVSAAFIADTLRSTMLRQHQRQYLSLAVNKVILNSLTHSCLVQFTS